MTELKNPYENLDSTKFWRFGVVDQHPFNIQGLYKKKWSIDPADNIATAGSCFAQHITRYLKKNNFNILDMEKPPFILSKKKHAQYGFSLYSARYGNIYTVRQLLQLLKEAILSFSPQEPIWESNGKFHDAFRPNIEPEGFKTPDEVVFHRKFHLSRVRDMVKKMDIFIFTLGLTESWVHKESGTVYPMAPGIIAGKYDPEIFEFKNFFYNEILDDFIEFQEIVSNIRKDLPPECVNIDEV